MEEKGDIISDWAGEDKETLVDALQGAEIHFQQMLQWYEDMHNHNEHKFSCRPSWASLDQPRELR